MTSVTIMIYDDNKVMLPTMMVLEYDDFDNQVTGTYQRRQVRRRVVLLSRLVALWFSVELQSMFSKNLSEP